MVSALALAERVSANASNRAEVRSFHSTVSFKAKNYAYALLMSVKGVFQLVQQVWVISCFFFFFPFLFLWNKLIWRTIVSSTWQNIYLTYLMKIREQTQPTVIFWHSIVAKHRPQFNFFFATNRSVERHVKIKARKKRNGHSISPCHCLALSFLYASRSTGSEKEGIL